MSALSYWLYLVFLVRLASKNTNVIQLKQLGSYLLKPIYGDVYRIYISNGGNLDLELDLLREIEIYG